MHPTPRLYSLLILGWCLAAPTALPALELAQLEVEQDGRRFEVRAESLIDAPASFVYAALSDYDNFHRLAGGLAETRWLSAPQAGEGLAYTRIDSCVLFFCKVIERVERVKLEPELGLHTEALPERSDFRVYRAHWQLEAAGDSTRLLFSASMEPDFWLPPLIGKWAIKRKLANTAQLVGERIEYLHRHGLTLAELPATSGREPAAATGGGGR